MNSWAIYTDARAVAFAQAAGVFSVIEKFRREKPRAPLPAGHGRNAVFRARVGKLHLVFTVHADFPAIDENGIQCFSVTSRKEADAVFVFLSALLGAVSASPLKVAPMKLPRPNN